MRIFKRYAILGGDGVFGIHMAKYLLDHNLAERVVCIGRNIRKPEVYSLGVGNHDPRYIYYQAHILHEADILMRIFDQEQPECIINFAALAYSTSWVDSFRYYDTNVIALAKLTELIRDKKYFKHWMQIGSSEVYGPAINGPSKETDTPNPTSPYAVSKLAGDLHLKTYFDSIDFPMNIIRPSNSYAPGQQLYRLMPKAAYCALNGIQFPLEGGGIAEKSFLHATDMANAIYKISTIAPLGEIYNAGTEASSSIRTIVELIAKVAGIEFNSFVKITDGRKTEDSRYWLDNSKINSELNWKPKISLELGVIEVVEWARKYLKDLATMNQKYELRS
jgi:dTDP-glucose 4,6-dehydratase